MARRGAPTHRASDAEREAVVDRLRAHAVAGRLDVDELAVRAGAAYRARTVGELGEVLLDLPTRPGLPGRRGQATRTWHAPVVGTLSGAAATVVVAELDGGFRGPLDGVAAVPFWVTFAFGAALAARIVGTRLRTRGASRRVG